MKRLSAVVLAAVILSIVTFGGIIAYAYEFIGSEIYYEDNTYDVYCSEKYEIDPYNDSWYFYNSEKNGEITLECKFDYSQGREKVPDSLTDKKYGKRYVTSISGSCGIKEFDLNPKNKYMKLVDK